MTLKEIKQGIINVLGLDLKFSDIDIFEVKDDVVYYRLDGKEYLYSTGTFNKN